jgi:hypothetical protein
MSLFIPLAEGVSLALALLVGAFVLGSMFFPPSAADTTSEDTSDLRMIRVVCRAAAGIAVYGVAVFFLATVGLLRPGFLAAVYVILIGCGVAISRGRPLSKDYWKRNLGDLVRCWNPWLLATFGIMLFLAVLAIPIFGYGSDAIEYHLAYAAEWANAGRLTVDPFVQFPFYANNFVLIFALFVAFHANAFVIFSIWGTGLMMAFGICAGIRAGLRDKVSSVWAGIAGIAGVLAVISSAEMLQIFSIAFIDVPIGAFALATAQSLYLAVVERRKSWLFAAAVVGGFWLGMKASFLILVLPVALEFIVAGRAQRTPWRSIAAAVSLLLLVASPWYVRNFILAGDPIAPVLNIALRHHDGLMTNLEWSLTQKSFHPLLEIWKLPLLPFLAFLRSTTIEFHSEGTNVLILFAYVPAIACLWLIVKRRLASAAGVYITFCTVLVGYWVLTSTMLRYASIFFPLLAVALFVLAGELVPKRRWTGPLLAAAALLMVLPNPTPLRPKPIGSVPFSDWQGTDFYRYFYESYRNGLQNYAANNNYITNAEVLGYHEEEFSTGVISRYRLAPFVYVFDEPMRYYFTIHKILDEASWQGPGGILRLTQAIDTGQAPRFMRALSVSAVLIAPDAPFAMAIPLAEQLAKGGFCVVHVPGSRDMLAVDLVPERCAALSAWTRKQKL